MWHSYLINLVDNNVRMENSTRQFDAQNIPFERIDAVNGWQLDDEQIARVYDASAAARRYKYPLIRPEIGCYLSHINAWQAIVDSGATGGFIFEDDFEICSPLAPLLEQLSISGQNINKDNESEMKRGPDWDIVKLFSIHENPRFVVSKQLDKTHTLTIPYQVPTCLLGYGITAKAARRLVRSSIPFFRPVDEDHKFFWEKNLRVALVCPSPIKVGDQQTKTGTIGGARDLTRGSLMSRIARSFNSAKYQLDYKRRLHFHRKFGNWI